MSTHEGRGGDLAEVQWLQVRGSCARIASPRQRTAGSDFVETCRMSTSKERRTRLVLTNVRDERGTMWRAVELTEGGGLAILGHDLGSGVEDVFGYGEYEFKHRLSATGVSSLRALLGVAEDADLLAAIEDRFKTTFELEAFIKKHDIPCELWSRVGD